MRKARFLSPQAESSSATYHCVSRVVDRRFVLGRKEKDVFVRMMREYEDFCGVQVLAFCIMSNHFHILVEVPPKVKDSPVEMSDEEFLRKMKAMYSPQHYRDVEQMIERFRSRRQGKAAEEFKAKYTCRMHDLSEFMKGLKQKFTQWYNAANGRRGTLWEGRFKSVLVEDGYAARVMAAYIDLNPIRAGMVRKPEDYKWCSYGEAMLPNEKKNAKARAGLCKVLDALKKVGGNGQFTEVDSSLTVWEDGLADAYRMMLFADGEEAFEETINKGAERKLKRVRKGFKRKDVEKTLAKGGKLSVGETLRCRVRYFTDGMTVGSKKFVNDVFSDAKERFGEKRTSGARVMRGVGWRKKEAKLFSMRALVKNRLE
ncbi:MAG: transposase [Akkermansiaceae bacterium]